MLFQLETLSTVKIGDILYLNKINYLFFIIAYSTMSCSQFFNFKFLECLKITIDGIRLITCTFLVLVTYCEQVYLNKVPFKLLNC